jgi:hypothetical protein
MSNKENYIKLHNYVLNELDGFEEITKFDQGYEGKIYSKDGIVIDDINYYIMIYNSITGYVGIEIVKCDKKWSRDKTIYREELKYDNLNDLKMCINDFYIVIKKKQIEDV